MSLMYAVASACHSFLSEQDLKIMFPKSWWRFFCTNHSLLENVFFNVAEKIANGNVIFKYIDKLWTLWILPFIFLMVSMLWLNCVPQRMKLNNICLEFEARTFKHYRIAMTTVFSPRICFSCLPHKILKTSKVLYWLFSIICLTIHPISPI